MKRISSILSLCGVVLLQACQGFPMKVDTTVFTPPGAAEPAPAKPPVSMVSPMMEKRETFVATGYSVISVQNSKNPSQQRLLAIRQLSAVKQNVPIATSLGNGQRMAKQSRVCGYQVVIGARRNIAEL